MQITKNKFKFNLIEERIEKKTLGQILENIIVYGTGLENLKNTPYSSIYPLFNIVAKQGKLNVIANEHGFKYQRNDLCRMTSTLNSSIYLN